MSKFKDFIISRKAAAFKKSVVEGKIPEQGSFITLFNNDYKVLTKPDSKIVILEDNRSNKIAYARDAITKMLSKTSGESVEKAEHYGAKPKTLVGEIGQNAKPSASAGGKASTAKPTDPVGTVRNGRKKVVSKRTGKTMWVNIATGEAHSEHNTHDAQELSPEAQAQGDSFFETAKNNVHPGDKMKLQRQMKDLMLLKQKAMNMLDMAHQDDRQKLPEGQLTRKKVFAMQDEYKKAFEQFKTDIKASVERRKKENF
jgi:hypothetical protein